MPFSRSLAKLATSTVTKFKLMQSALQSPSSHPGCKYSGNAEQEANIRPPTTHQIIGVPKDQTIVILDHAILARDFEGDTTLDRKVAGMSW